MMTPSWRARKDRTSFFIRMTWAMIRDFVFAAIDVTRTRSKIIAGTIHAATKIDTKTITITFHRNSFHMWRPDAMRTRRRPLEAT